MTKLEPNRKAGEILIATEGEYSDYHIIGAFCVLKDFSLDAFTRKAIKQIGPNGQSWWASEKIDYAGMAKAGIVEDIDFTEVWCGD